MIVSVMVVLKVFGMEGTGESADPGTGQGHWKLMRYGLAGEPKRQMLLLAPIPGVMVGMWVGPGDHSEQSFLLGEKQLALWDCKAPCSQSETGVCFWNISEEPGV